MYGILLAECMRGSPAVCRCVCNVCLATVTADTGIFSKDVSMAVLSPQTTTQPHCFQKQSVLLWLFGIHACYEVMYRTVPAEVGDHVDMLYIMCALLAA